MEGIERKKYDPTVEQTLDGETEYFNKKFPPVGGWLSVQVREARPGSGEVGNARRFELIVNTEAGPDAQNPESELFVCFYDEGDPDRRQRAEKLLADIYPIFSNKEESK
jgi:hypothetical protein